MGRHTKLKRKMQDKPAVRSSLRKKMHASQQSVLQSEDNEERDKISEMMRRKDLMRKLQDKLEERRSLREKMQSSSHPHSEDIEERDTKFVVKTASSESEDRNLRSVAEDASFQSEDNGDRDTMFSIERSSQRGDTDDRSRVTKFKTEEVSQSEEMEYTEYKNVVGAARFRCKVCDEEFYRKEDYSNHLKYHEEDPRYHCPTCMKSFNDEDLFKEHEKTHKTPMKTEKKVFRPQLVICKWEALTDQNLRNENVGTVKSEDLDELESVVDPGHGTEEPDEETGVDPGHGTEEPDEETGVDPGHGTEDLDETYESDESSMKIDIKKINSEEIQMDPQSSTCTSLELNIMPEDASEKLDQIAFENDDTETCSNIDSDDAAADSRMLDDTVSESDSENLNSEEIPSCSTMESEEAEKEPNFHITSRLEDSTTDVRNSAKDSMNHEIEVDKNSTEKDVRAESYNDKLRRRSEKKHYFRIASRLKDSSSEVENSANDSKDHEIEGVKRSAKDDGAENEDDGSKMTSGVRTNHIKMKDKESHESTVTSLVEGDCVKTGNEDDESTVMSEPASINNDSDTEMKHDLTSSRSHREKKKTKHFGVTFPAFNKKLPIKVINESPHKCEECGVCLHSKHYLKRHQLIHQDEKPHVCDVCQKQYRWRKGFVKHLYKHTENPQKCSKCQKWFASEKNLAKHAKTCSGKGKKPMESKEVNNTIKDKDKSKNQICEICGQGYNNIAHLREHQLIHFEKKFICSYCGKAFAQQNGLRKHERYHTDYRPYSCDVCPKSYYTATSLKRHKVIHTDDAPFKCNICGKCFAFQHMLKEHEDIKHKEKKPFACTECDETFAYKCSLKNHMQKNVHK